ncbi:10021_t:CDS:1, partial [Funneliformis geosporum]
MSSLPNLRNLAYSILKNLEDEIVNGKEFTKLGNAYNAIKRSFLLTLRRLLCYRVA